MKQLLTITLCLLCVTAHAELNAIGKARGLTPDRVDKDTNEKLSKMDNTLYTNAVLWVPFSFDDGVNAYDLSTSINDGAATNANTTPIFSAASGGVMDFDGVDDFITMGDPAGLDGFTSGATFMVWAKRTTIGAYHRIFNKYSTGDDERSYLIFFDNNNNILFAISADGTSATYDALTTTAAYTSTTTWLHIAGVWPDNDRVEIYVNGVVQAGARSGAAQSQIHAGTDELYISSRKESANQFFPGSIDDVRIYERALSSNEQFNIYNNTKGTYGL